MLVGRIEKSRLIDCIAKSYPTSVGDWMERD